MSSAVAGEVMGPRPGLAIVSFPQGIISVGLRIAVLALLFVVFITACVAVGTINDIDEDYLDDVIDEDEDDRPFNRIGDAEFPNTPGIAAGSRGACGWVILLCLLAFFYEPLVIILRFLNIGLVNLYIYIVLGIDIALSSLFALGLLAGAISEAAWAGGWWQWQEFLDDLEDEVGSGPVDDLVDDENLYFDRIVGAMGASAAFAFLAMFVFIALVVWMILFLVFKWNENVVKYTVREAAPVKY